MTMSYFKNAHKIREKTRVSENLDTVSNGESAQE